MISPPPRLMIMMSRHPYAGDAPGHAIVHVGPE